MSTVETGHHKSTDPGSVSFSERLDNVFSLVTTALGEADVSEKTVTAIEEEVDPLIDEAEQLEQSESVAEYRESNEKDKASIRERVSSLEEGASGDGNPGGQTEETPLYRPETPLERIISLPEGIAQEELSANQERSRFLGMDIKDYATSVPAGYALTSSTIRKVISAKEGSRCHTETSSRIMGFLDDLGKEGVKLVESHGTKKVIFKQETVERIQQLSSQGCGSPEGVKV